MATELIKEIKVMLIGVNPEGLGGRDPQILGWGTRGGRYENIS